LDLIHKSGITTPGRLATAVPDPAALPREPGKAAGVLIQKGVITRFQAQQLLQGRHKGFLLGAYVILDQLGRGGMGAVYLAEHRDLHRKVAVKVLVTAKDEDHRLANERFFREARAAAALDHPNIVRIFDVSRHNDVPYLVMEYVGGETLQQTLDRSGAVSATDAADVVAQAAAGLQHAHERGFVHRDIKPGNLIRDRFGVVKILDMGLARSFSDPDHKLTEKLDAGAVVGTADFIAPEQALNSPQIDIRADIYSLGATFFSLVAGRPPFEGNTTQKLLHHQMRSAPHLSEVDPTLPPGLTAVVAKMLSKKPQDRYQTPAEVIAALSPWLGNRVRVLAGLSRTNLVNGSDAHSSLHDLVSGASSGRLVSSPPPSEGDSAEFNPSLAAMDTRAIASSETARSPASPGVRLPAQADTVPESRASDRKKLVVFAGVALAMLAIGLVVGWLAFGR
jgi:serine/threonine protein kinase